MNTTTLHTTTTNNNTITDNPYRVEAYVERCVICGNSALLSCPRCGRAFCELHASVSGCCADCELELSARTRRVIGPSMVAYVVLAVVPVVLVAQATMYHLAVFTAALMFFGGLLLAGVLGRLVRRGANGPWIPVANCVLHIAADGGEAAPRRRAGRARERCMYKAAWNAGFNRVQGCA